MHKDNCPWKNGFSERLYFNNPYGGDMSLEITDESVAYDENANMPDPGNYMLFFNFCPMCGVSLEEEDSPSVVSDEALWSAIRKALSAFRCQHSRDEQGDGMELLDVLSPGETVAEGQEELGGLADHLFHELRNFKSMQPIPTEIEVVLNQCYGGFSLSDKAADRLEELGALPEVGRLDGEADDNYRYRRVSKLKRTDPALVQVVKELGKNASGECSDLTVKTVRFNVEDYIEDHAGNERIEGLPVEG